LSENLHIIAFIVFELFSKNRMRDGINLVVVNPTARIRNLRPRYNKIGVLVTQKLCLKLSKKFKKAFNFV